MPDKLQIYIALIAALVCMIVNIFLKASFFDMTSRMITVIILFYILGIIVKAYLKKTVFPESESNLQTTEDDSDSEPDDDVDTESEDY